MRLPGRLRVPRVDPKLVVRNEHEDGGDLRNRESREIQFGQEKPLLAQAPCRNYGDT